MSSVRVWTMECGKLTKIWPNRIIPQEWLGGHNSLLAYVEWVNLDFGCTVVIKSSWIQLRNYSNSSISLVLHKLWGLISTLFLVLVEQKIGMKGIFQRSFPLPPDCSSFYLLIWIYDFKACKSFVFMSFSWVNWLIWKMKPIIIPHTYNQARQSQR